MYMQLLIFSTMSVGGASQ